MLSEQVLQVRFGIISPSPSARLSTAGCQGTTWCPGEAAPALTHEMWSPPSLLLVLEIQRRPGLKSVPEVGQGQRELGPSTLGSTRNGVTNKAFPQEWPHPANPKSQRHKPIGPNRQQEQAVPRTKAMPKIWGCGSKTPAALNNNESDNLAFQRVRSWQSLPLWEGPQGFN